METTYHPSADNNNLASFCKLHAYAHPLKHRFLHDSPRRAEVVCWGGKCSSSPTMLQSSVPFQLHHAVISMAFQGKLLNPWLKMKHFRCKGELLLSEKNRDVKVRWDLRPSPCTPGRHLWLKAEDRELEN